MGAPRGLIAILAFLAACPPAAASDGYFDFNALALTALGREPQRTADF